MGEWELRLWSDHEDTFHLAIFKSFGYHKDELPSLGMTHTGAR